MPSLERIGLQTRRINRLDDRGASMDFAERLGRVGKNVILNEFAEHMAQRDVAFLNARCQRRRDDEGVIDHPGQLAARSRRSRRRS